MTMAATNLKTLLIGLAMLLAASLALALAPRTKIADQGPKVDLEAMIPKQLGVWRLDESIVPLQVSPDVQAKLDKIYSQTLAWTYVNDKGYRIMLSIAYGSNQSDALAVHKPEVCYPAQGFEVLQQVDGLISYQKNSVPVRRLLARSGARLEPITYWITVGDKATVGRYERKLAQLAYTMTGKVPDGMLVRVSSIDDSTSRAYRYQEMFIDSLLTHLQPATLEKMVGKLNATQ